MATEGCGPPPGRLLLPGHSTPAAGLAHLPATPLRGGTPSRHLLNQPLANFTLSSGSGARGTMTRHQTPGRRSKLTSNWGDWAKVQMSLTEGENAVVCSYDRGDLPVEEAPELRLEGSTGSTCTSTWGWSARTVAQEKVKGQNFLDHVEHQE